MRGPSGFRGRHWDMRMTSSRQIPLDESARADDRERDSQRNDGTLEIRPDLAYRRLAIVNVIFVGPPGAKDREWVLVDAGLVGTKAFIHSAAVERFGPHSRPAAILLTHGHFDHVGALEELSREWDVPIYAHPLEHPYLNGREAYPPPDPTVGGGLMALSSSLFPRGPIDVSGRLKALPEGRNSSAAGGLALVADSGPLPRPRVVLA